VWLSCLRNLDSQWMYGLIQYQSFPMVFFPCIQSKGNFTPKWSLLSRWKTRLSNHWIRDSPNRILMNNRPTFWHKLPRPSLIVVKDCFEFYRRWVSCSINFQHWGNINYEFSSSSMTWRKIDVTIIASCYISHHSLSFGNSKGKNFICYWTYHFDCISVDGCYHSTVNNFEVSSSYSYSFDFCFRIS